MRRVLAWLFGALAFGFLAVALYRLLDDGRHLEWASIQHGRLALSLLGVLGLILSMAEIWRRLAAHLGAGSLGAAAGLHVHVVGWLGRYIPGKLLGMLGKVLLAEERGLRRVPLAAAATYEQIYFFAVGAGLSALLLLPLPGVLRLVLAGPLFLAIATTLWLGLPLLTPLLNRLGRQDEPLPRLSFGSHLVLAATYLVPHLAVGLGFWLMLGAIGEPDIGPAQAVGYITAAHVAGMAAFLAPAGVGAREAALTALLAQHVDLDRALAIAAFTRLWATAGDATAGLYSLAFWGLRRK